ncbi:uncharacterized protein LOC126985829 [Eriocheir sinensis]|uniref:uncharacterized protein LOC126985829 n=1 Tax=Eriocheir sinensis TaxID=95602 RepID=UPI0021CA83BC|nr:uncharacterized protein LOC126985829 [Eriocheir sinensis]
MASGGVQTPRFGAEITEAWLQYMLTCYERRRDPQAEVKVINHSVRAGTKPGENVASELLKIWVEVELTGRRRDEKEEDKETGKERKNQESKNKEEKTQENNSISDTNNHTTTTTTTASSPTTTSTKEYNLVAKFNTGSEFDQEYAKYINMDLNELLIYSDVMTHLNAWQEQVLKEKGEEGEALDRYKVLVPEFVYGVCTYNEYVVVMQDVSVLGYTTQDKMEGLDLPHVLMATDRVARLHALSHAFHKTNNFLSHYPSFLPDERLFNFFTGFMFVMIDFVVQMASQRPEFAPIVEKFRDNQENIKARMLEAMKKGHPKNPVLSLVHADYWTNNLMFSHETTSTSVKAKTPQDLMLIDWGLVRWGNPIFDLHQLVFNCTTRSLRQQHLQEVLQRYHSTFTAATTALGAPVVGYDFTEFLKEWRRTSVVGYMQAGLFANTIVLSRKAPECFKKGSPNSGLKAVALRMLGKVMVPLVLNGWFRESILNSTKKSFQPLLDELLSGENHVMTSRLLDTLEEAYQAGVLDG